MVSSKDGDEGEFLFHKIKITCYLSNCIRKKNSQQLKPLNHRPEIWEHLSIHFIKLFIYINIYVYIYIYIYLVLPYVFHLLL